jgi:hypothetical protein
MVRRGGIPVWSDDRRLRRGEQPLARRDGGDLSRLLGLRGELCRTGERGAIRGPCPAG